MRAAFSLLTLTGCMWVLDLDAEADGPSGAAAGASTGGRAEGGSEATAGGNAAGAGAQGGSPQGGSPQGGSPQGGSPQGGSPQGGSPQGGSPQGGGGAGPLCDDGFLHFDGTQYLQIEDGGDALKLQNDVSIGVWVSAEQGTGTGERFIFSRLSSTKGYALLLVESGENFYPELRLFNGGACSCVSSVPLPANTLAHVAANFTKPNAEVWLNGTSVCTQVCQNNDIDTESATPKVGRSMTGQNGFFQGTLDDVFVQSPGDTPPPQLSGGGCSGLQLLLTFDAPLPQSGSPNCGTGLTVVLGVSASNTNDDPVHQVCP